MLDIRKARISAPPFLVHLAAAIAAATAVIRAAKAMIAAVAATAAPQDNDRDHNDDPPGIITEKTIVIAARTHTNYLLG